MTYKPRLIAKWHDYINLKSNSMNYDSIIFCYRSFTRYQACFDDIRQSCPEGVKNILDYNADLRSYMLKMDYICNGHKKCE